MGSPPGTAFLFLDDARRRGKGLGTSAVKLYGMGQSNEATLLYLKALGTMGKFVTTFSCILGIEPRFITNAFIFRFFLKDFWLCVGSWVSPSNLACDGK